MNGYLRSARPELQAPFEAAAVTVLAGAIDDLYGLMGWKQRQTAVGLAADKADYRQRIDRLEHDLMKQKSFNR